MAGVKEFIPENCVFSKADKVYVDGIFKVWHFSVMTEHDDMIEWKTDVISEYATKKQIRNVTEDFLYLHPKSIDKEVVRGRKINNLLDE